MSINKFKLNNKLIGKDQKSFIIAEIAQAHDGSLGIAHSYIDLAKKCGADAIKFQTHIADQESSKDDIFRVNFSYCDKTRYDYWKRMEFTKDQWIELKKHSDSLGLTFLSTAFSKKAFEILEEMNIPAWKVSSGEIFNKELIDLFISTKKPIILSSGMSLDSELAKIISYIKEYTRDICLMQCTTKYPTEIEEIGFNYMLNIEKKFDVVPGLSDHSGITSPAIAAIANNIPMIECHLTFNKGMFGPDTKSSLDENQFKQICDFRDEFYRMKSAKYIKDKMSSELSDVKKLFTRSAFSKRKILKGEKLTHKDIIFKKPGTGININSIEKFINRTVKIDIDFDVMISKDYF